MEDASLTKSQGTTTTNANTNTNTNGRAANHPRTSGSAEGRNDSSFVDKQCDVEVWKMLSKSFRQAQSVLDRNRKLISQVNENHQSRVPDNMLKNVALINEIHGNISQVLSIYSDLSASFSSAVHQRHTLKDGVDRSGDRQSESAERPDGVGVGTVGYQ